MKSGPKCGQNLNKFQYQLSYTYTESLLTHIHIATYVQTRAHVHKAPIYTYTYMNAMSGVVINLKWNGTEPIRGRATLKLNFFSLRDNTLY